MKILFVSSKNDIYTNELFKNLNQNKYEFFLLDVNQQQFINLSKNTKINFNKNRLFSTIPIVKYLYFTINSYFFIKNKKYKFDTIHILYKKNRYFFLINLFTKISKKIILSIYGSDFYKNSLKRFDKFFYEKINIITFANQATKTAFNNFYNNIFANKTIYCPFGQNNLDHINKIKKTEIKIQSKKNLKIPKNKFVICCCSNGSSNEQPEKVINQLSKIKNKSKIFLIFPLTYGTSISRTNKLKKIIKSKLTDFETMIIDKYLSSENIARLRICTDILINVRKTDQLSGAMLENLYAGNITISGSWLPYTILDDKKINYIKIQNISKLNNKITYCLNNITKLKKQNITNSDKIYKICSWKNNINNWKKLY